MTPTEAAEQLRAMAKNLWSVEFRIDVDKDAELLERAATLLLAPELRAFSASDKACYLWPDDTEEHKTARAAYCQGAADYGAPPSD